MAGVYDGLDGLIAKLAAASWKERDPIKAQLMEAAGQLPDRKGVLAHLDQARRDIQELEVRWEIEEVIEKLTPPPPAKAEEPKAPDKNKQLTAADLNLVYDDPRGLMLHKTKVGERWFATQRDPRTGQPQTFELRAEEVSQLKMQLAGSPYWILGAGA
jgi:hypothetical protein